MGWVDDLRGAIIGIDTSPFIYLTEEHPAYLDAVRSFFSEMNDGGITGVTSTVTLLEVLVQPFRRGVLKLADQYRQTILNANNLSCMELTAEIASAPTTTCAHPMRFNWRLPSKHARRRS